MMLGLTDAAAAALVGDAVFERCRDLVFRPMAAHAEGHGLLLADTKLEFGLIDGEVVDHEDVAADDPELELRVGEDQAPCPRRVSGQPVDREGSVPATGEHVLADQRDRRRVGEGLRRGRRRARPSWWW